MKGYVLTDEERQQVKECLMAFVRECCAGENTKPEALTVLPAVAELLLNKF